MIKTLILFVVMALPILAETTIHREGTEWCDIWIAKATDKKLPRVMLVGDSITKGYFKVAEKQLQGKASCARFATSACVSDPAFFAQLDAMFSHYQYAVIHINNGLHGMGYSEEEYREGYEKALQLIRKKAPKAKLILALSTPLQSTSNVNKLNPRVDERNRIVRELAQKYGATINDLHGISKGRPDYYKDPYHYKPVAIDLQGKRVGETVKKALEQ